MLEMFSIGTLDNVRRRRVPHSDGARDVARSSDNSEFGRMARGTVDDVRVVTFHWDERRMECVYLKVYALRYIITI